MGDRILGVLALGLLIGFLGVLVSFVPELDLIIVVVIAISLAGYDFFLSLFRQKNGSGS